MATNYLTLSANRLVIVVTNILHTCKANNSTTSLRAAGLLERQPDPSFVTLETRDRDQGSTDLDVVSVEVEDALAVWLPILHLARVRSELKLQRFLQPKG